MSPKAGWRKAANQRTTAVPAPERLKDMRWVLREESRVTPYINKSSSQIPNGKPTCIRLNFSSMVSGSYSPCSPVLQGQNQVLLLQEEDSEAGPGLAMVALGRDARGH